MAELLSDGVDANKLPENDEKISAVDADASAVSATDGQDKSFESARGPTTNSGSLSPSPVENLEAGFYKVQLWHAKYERYVDCGNMELSGSSFISHYILCH